MHRGAENLREVIVASRERKFGESKYKNIRKVIKGLPEVTGFIIRMMTRYYNVTTRHELPSIRWDSSPKTGVSNGKEKRDNLAR